jgi:DnaK suppressor protein
LIIPFLGIPAVSGIPGAWLRTAIIGWKVEAGIKKHMTEKVAAQFKKLLLARRDDLARQIVQTVAAPEPEENPQVLPPDEPVSADSAAAIAPSGQDAHAQGLIAQMDAALARIAAGTYGECIACNKEIGTKRLVAFPCARYCLACASTLRKRL